MTQRASTCYLLFFSLYSTRQRTAVYDAIMNNIFFAPLLLFYLKSSAASASWLFLVAAACNNLQLPSSAFTYHPTSTRRAHIMSSSTTSLFETKKPPPSIQWGIIGLGDVCTIKSGPAFYKSHGSKLIAVMRRTPGVAQKWVDENREVVER